MSTTTPTESVSFLITPSDYPDVDNTGATDTRRALQTAIDSAPSGALITLRGTYLIAGTLEIPPYRSLTLDLSGATLVRAQEGIMVRCAGTYESSISIAAISSTKVTLDEGSTTVTSLTLSEDTDWGHGDLVKVVSDDVIEGAHVTSTVFKPRRGEFAEVHSRSGKTIYLKGVLREAFITAPRVARLPFGTLRVIGGTMDVTPEVIASKLSGTAFRLENLVRPSVSGMTGRRLVGTGLSFKSCFGYRVDNFGVAWAMNSPAAEVFGYGIHDSSSTNGVITGGTLRALRHAYTDGTADVPAGHDSLSSFGRTLNTRLIGVTSHDCTAAGFDTHHMSRGVQFANCTAYVSPEVSGFLLRGHGHSIVDCTVYGGREAVRIMTQASGNWSTGESWGHTVDNLQVTSGSRVLTVANRMASSHPEHAKRPSQTTVSMRNVVAVDVQQFAQVVNAKVSISDVEFTSSKHANGMFIQCQNSDLQLRDITLDLNPIETAQSLWQRIIQVDPLSGESSSFRAEGIQIKASQVYRNASSRPIMANSNTELFIATGVEFESPWAVPDPFVVPSSVPQALNWRCAPNPANALSRGSSATTLLKNDALLDSIGNVVRSTDSFIILNAEITDGTARSLPRIPPGQFDGQRMLIRLRSGAALTIRNGSSFNTALQSETDRVLRNSREGCQLVWVDSAWRELG